jgi:hypothetical protein
MSLSAPDHAPPVTGAGRERRGEPYGDCWLNLISRPGHSAGAVLTGTKKLGLSLFATSRGTKAK